MPCGRESTSAAALRPLVLMLFLFSAMPRGALSRGLALPALRRITCNSIPSPFGVRGRSLPGFKVTCGRNKEAMLKIDKHSYKIVDMSVERAFVVILAGPIRRVCHHRNGKQMQATGIGKISLDRTPFSFSKRNKLVVAGCNYRLAANFSNSPVGDNPSQHGETTACSTHCDKNSVLVNCFLEDACCKAPMPMNTSGDFTLKLDKIPGMGDEAGTCGTAFFLDQDVEVFVGRPLKDYLLPAGDHRMILDWVVGRGTCSQASRHNLARRYCNSMSGCIDAPSGAGYLCNCNEGYGGNPYTTGVCVDKDECRNFESNPCNITEFCNNTIGSFTCSCPYNMIGDGYKNGTGCTEALIPSGSPMPRPQGLNVCNHPEKYPCVYLDSCSSDGEVATCDCPHGMVRDGREKGKSCQKYFPLETALGKLA